MKTSVKRAPKEKPKTFKHYVSWFEIPAYNFQRAVSFFNYIYDINMNVTEINGYAMGFFPAEDGIGGAVVTGEGCVPGSTGPLLYLNGGKDLDAILTRVEPAGGRIIMNKTLINEAVGYFAIFMDTEGNRLAIHSKN